MGTPTNSPTAATNEVSVATVIPARVELGCPGHFICANDCRFRRHTQVGNYRISTVGDLYFGHEPGKRQTIGSGDDDWFETYVFELTDQPVADSDGCGCREVKSFSEIDGERTASAGQAQAAHERYVAKYLAIAKAEGR